MRTMGIPTQCPTKGPEWFVENYDRICKLLVKGLATNEIGTALEEKGVKLTGGFDNLGNGISTKVSKMVNDFKFPDFPQLKGYAKRTTRSRKPTFSYSPGEARTESFDEMGATTIETADTILAGEGGIKVRFKKPVTQFEVVMKKLVAIDRVVNSKEFDETSKIKYIRAELNN